MNDPEDIESLERNVLRITEVPRPRAVGSPLPMGATGSRPAETVVQGEAPRISSANVPAVKPRQAPGDEPDRESDSESDEEIDDIDLPSGQISNLQRAMKGVRMALPLVQKILPLLDGQVLTAISNLLAPRAAAPPPPVNLTPLQDTIVVLEAQHRELRNQIADQNALLKRVDDRLEMVREATDRNTLEQQELLEDLKKVGHTSTVVATVAITLLVLLIAGDVVFYLHMRGVLRW